MVIQSVSTYLIKSNFSIKLCLIVHLAAAAWTVIHQWRHLLHLSLSCASFLSWNVKTWSLWNKSPSHRLSMKLKLPISSSLTSPIINIVIKVKPFLTITSWGWKFNYYCLYSLLCFPEINADSYSGDEVLTSKEGLLRRRKGDSKSRDTKSTYNNHFEHIVFFQPTMPC